MPKTDDRKEKRECQNEEGCKIRKIDYQNRKKKRM